MVVLESIETAHGTYAITKANVVACNQFNCAVELTLVKADTDIWNSSHRYSQTYVQLVPTVEILRTERCTKAMPGPRTDYRKLIAKLSHDMHSRANSLIGPERSPL